MVDVDEIEEPESGQLEDVETAGQTGGSGSAAAAQPTVNRVCPMDDHRVDPNAPKRDFHGEVVGFCCERCAGDWDALPDEEKQDHLVVVDDINE